MTNITVVTTFHQAGLELYGQRFLDSFAKRVDKRIKLLVYTENCNPVNPDPDQVIILNAADSLTKLNAFKSRWRDVPKANGKCPWPERRPRDWNKEFKWNAVRFANKVYAVFDACNRSSDYEDADNGIFLLDEWHDSFVFGTILNQMKNRHPNVLDYSAEMYLTQAKTGGGGHPLINTKLGQWIDHMKGDRKTLGKSKSSDIMVKRKEGYWQ